jgi:hypothetical protein
MPVESATPDRMDDSNIAARRSTLYSRRPFRLGRQARVAASK